MNPQTNFFSGMVVGAGLMYMLDPARGKRRRALVRDQVVHGAHELGDVGDRIAGKSQDLRHRARGALAETRARWRQEEVDDDVLEARVRAEIGRVASDPGAIEVTARNGRVTLTGSVPEGETQDLLATVGSVRGTEEVESRLQVQTDSEPLPGRAQGSD